MFAENDERIGRSQVTGSEASLESANILGQGGQGTENFPRITLPRFTKAAGDPLLRAALDRALTGR